MYMTLHTAKQKGKGTILLYINIVEQEVGLMYVNVGISDMVPEHKYNYVLIIMYSYVQLCM